MKTMLKRLFLMICVCLLIPSVSGCSNNLRNTAAAVNQTLIVENNSSSSITVYMGFNNGSMGSYSQSDFPICSWLAANPLICYFQLGPAIPLTPNSPPNKQTFALTNGNFNVAISANIAAWSTCGGGTGLTMAELNLNTSGSDWYDISLVNGFNYGMSITPSSGNPIIVTSELGNSQNTGVFPAGCDICSGSQNPPSGPGCPGTQYGATEGHINNQPACLYTQPTVPKYTVSIFDGS
ncbi:thaumatin family protein [Candidatus Methylospira mobilis]|nr:thaumatin family protein [Candidatus Methylospira mobilis]